MVISQDYLWKFILKVSIEEAAFNRRGFHIGTIQARDWLEQIGQTFLAGYQMALEESDFEALSSRLHKVEPILEGFSFEGAAMAIVLLDQLSPWRANRFPALVEGPGSMHVYMLYVGAGWALARLHCPIDRFISHLDPVLRWLVVDGYGFHEGYFHWQQYVIRKDIPNRLHGYALRVFDQGLGRSLWFIDGADVSRLPRTIASFHSDRQPDLWSGVGLACAYAGGVDSAELQRLQASADGFRLHLAQGAAFAAQARRRAGNAALHTETACQILCQLSAKESALITEQALVGLPSIGNEPAYEVWRSRIRNLIAQRQNDVSQPSLLSQTNKEIML